MAQVPEVEVQAIPSEIGVPILEKLAYVSDEEISNIYVKLLANAATVSLAENAHPAYIAVLENLAPDEALLMRTIGPPGAIHIIATYACRLKLAPRNFADLYHQPYFLFVFDPKDARREKIKYPLNIPIYIANLGYDWGSSKKI